MTAVLWPNQMFVNSLHLPNFGVFSICYISYCCVQLYFSGHAMEAAMVRDSACVEKEQGV